MYKKHKIASKLDIYRFTPPISTENYIYGLFTIIHMSFTKAFHIHATVKCECMKLTHHSGGDGTPNRE